MKETLELWHLIVGLIGIAIAVVIYVFNLSSKLATEKTLIESQIKALELQINSIKERLSKQDTEDKESKMLLHAIQLQLQAITTTLIERDKAADAMNKVIDYITHKQNKNVSN